MVFTMINQHYLQQIDAICKVRYKISYTANYKSDQLLKCIDES